MCFIIGNTLRYIVISQSERGKQIFHRQHFRNKFSCVSIIGVSAAFNIFEFVRFIWRVLVPRVSFYEKLLAAAEMIVNPSQAAMVPRDSWKK